VLRDGDRVVGYALVRLEPEPFARWQQRAGARFTAHVVPRPLTGRYPASISRFYRLRLRDGWDMWRRDRRPPAQRHPHLADGFAGRAAHGPPPRPRPPRRRLSRTGSYIGTAFSTGGCGKGGCRPFGSMSGPTVAGPLHPSHVFSPRRLSRSSPPWPPWRRREAGTRRAAQRVRRLREGLHEGGRMPRSLVKPHRRVSAVREGAPKLTRDNPRHGQW
jgi:hypothetical protein